MLQVFDTYIIRKCNFLRSFVLKIFSGKLNLDASWTKFIDLLMHLFPLLL